MASSSDIQIVLARHFDLTAPSERCGACDVCTNSEDWRAQNFAQRSVISGAEVEKAGDGKAFADSVRFERGDWVKIDDRHMGQVVRVDEEKGCVKLVVEGASDLRRHTVDLRRQRVEKL